MNTFTYHILHMAHLRPTCSWLHHIPANALLQASLMHACILLSSLHAEPSAQKFDLI